MALVANYSSSSSCSDSDHADSASEIETKKQFESEKPKLPSASNLLALSASKKGSEVFNNPFREAENAKLSLLEKHVKMVNKDEHLTQKNGRKICWNYRRGRCRFGSKCSFAHDSDISSDLQSRPEEAFSGKNSETKEELAVQELTSGEDLSNRKIDILNSHIQKKRKRPGLGDSIVPSKKVIESYKQRKLKR